MQGGCSVSKRCLIFIFTFFSFYYPESNSGLKNREMVDFILNRSLDALRDYIKCSYPDKPSRFAHILLRLPTLRHVSSKMATECLFAKSFLNLAVPQVMSFVMEMKVEIWKSLAYHWNIGVSLFHFDFLCFWFFNSVKANNSQFRYLLFWGISEKCQSTACCCSDVTACNWGQPNIYGHEDIVSLSGYWIKSLMCSGLATLRMCDILKMNCKLSDISQIVT